MITNIMFSKMNLQRKSPRISLITAGLFLLLFSATPLLHNHAATPYEPPNCPTHILQLSLHSSGAALVASFAIPLLVSRFCFPLLTTLFQPSDVDTHFGRRAPPSLG